MRDQARPKSTITWFYYRDLETAAKFYQETMGFELVVDQEWTRIFRINEGAYVGTVAGEKGFCQPQASNAVLLTVVIDEDVTPWFKKLQDSGANLITEVLYKEDIQVQCFFLKDPGGYSVEVQRFVDPEVSVLFI